MNWSQLRADWVEYGWDGYGMVYGVPKNITCTFIYSLAYFLWIFWLLKYVFFVVCVCVCCVWYVSVCVCVV